MTNPLKNLSPEKELEVRARIKQNFRRREKTPGTYAWFYRRYQRVRRSAKDRYVKHAFELSFEEFRVIYSGTSCFYCGFIFNDYQTNVKRELKSIDRVDNEKGYSKQNCVLSCFDCNYIKGGMNKERLNKMLFICQKSLDFIK